MSLVPADGGAMLVVAADIGTEASAMTTVHTAPTAVRRPASREVEVLLRYDDADVERAAERAGVELSPAERDAILLMLDDDVSRLVRDGFDAALARFVRRELQVVAAGHRDSEDD